MDTKLNYRIWGEGDKTLVFSHGVLGYWRNFYSISQILKKNYTCLLYDQRGHGQSFHKEPYTVKNLAQDLKELLKFLELKPVILLGHSLGGWVCSYLAYKEPELVEKLIVVDSSPWPKDSAGKEIKKILSYLPESFPNRKKAREFFNQAIKEGLFSKQLSYFLMSSLDRESKNTVRFLFDKKGLLNLLPAVRQLDYPSMIEKLKIPILFLRGENSSHFLKEDLEETLRLNPLIKGLEIKNSGHWLHAEQPKDFLKAIEEFLIS
ncbi:MAG: alpha/beta hydrolase [Bdellovibrionaceae bacterium]|nr:alpha/beta hydrolase [Pseudobdellovibrionaceae bacterium]